MKLCKCPKIVEDFQALYELQRALMFDHLNLVVMSARAEALLSSEEPQSTPQQARFSMPVDHDSTPKSHSA